MHHPEKLVAAFGACAGDMPVRVYANDLYIMGSSISTAVRDLPFYGLVRLPWPF
jgi:hypothetical protein